MIRKIEFRCLDCPKGSNYIRDDVVKKNHFEVFEYKSHRIVTVEEFEQTGKS